ncbi:acyl-CoA thioesterase [Niabella hibiscisoli]|uniref:acyl-CoA thioesterase n=1 Tax=Niabella hibiscisoli TaxID=1825928 RepID=UPI001F10EF00|nr:hypothetical protein [Niabella hibiscisoli]MCH5718100.1 hypothetical protein [Niabella hibiscisoli]
MEIIEKKLSHIQVTPPNSVWVNIIKELEDKKKEPALVVPMNHGWLKYAAAACFIAIVSISAFFILSDGNSGKDYTAGNGGKTKGTPNVANAIQAGAPQQANTQNRQQQALAGIRTKLGNAYSASNERNADLQNRYIILMTQDGNIVRMSKKVSNMADCIAGEDHSCDDQISKWQKEMASSNAAASPDNFLDLLDMASGDAAETSTPLTCNRFSPDRECLHLFLRKKKMARIKVPLPPHFTFSTSIAIRITDVNYGGHVGNDAILSIIHEARLQFLKALGYSEMNIEELV